MEITEIKITLRNEEKLKAFVSVTFDNAFVIRGLKVISGNNGYFVSMPSRKRKDGTYQDIAHPINNEMRKSLEDKVLDAYENRVCQRATTCICQWKRGRQYGCRSSCRASCEYRFRGRKGDIKTLRNYPVGMTCKTISFLENKNWGVVKW